MSRRIQLVLTVGALFLCALQAPDTWRALHPSIVGDWIVGTPMAAAAETERPQRVAHSAAEHGAAGSLQPFELVRFAYSAATRTLACLHLPHAAGVAASELADGGVRLVRRAG